MQCVFSSLFRPITKLMWIPACNETNLQADTQWKGKGIRETTLLINGFKPKTTKSSFCRPAGCFNDCGMGPYVGLSSSSSSIYSIVSGPRPLHAYTHSVNLTKTFRYTYTWKQRIGIAGRIVNLTPHNKSFNALALAFNGHWNITLLTTKQLIYYPTHEIFFKVKPIYTNFARFLVTFLLLHFRSSRHLILEGRYQ